MEKAKEDLRVVKTKASIKDALYQLIAEKRFKDITVVELCKKAQIGRKTFYLHYYSIENVINEIFQEHIQDVNKSIEEVTANMKFLMIKELFNCLNQTISRNLVFFKRIVSEDSYATLLNNYIRTFKEISKQQLLKARIHHPKEEIYLEFFAAGIIEIYVKWLKDDLSASLDELAAFSENVLNNGIRGLYNGA